MRLVNLEDWNKGFQDGVECATTKEDPQKHQPPFSVDFVEGWHAGVKSYYAAMKEKKE